MKTQTKLVAAVCTAAIATAGAAVPATAATTPAPGPEVSQAAEAKLTPYVYAIGNDVYAGFSGSQTGWALDTPASVKITMTNGKTWTINGAVRANGTLFGSDQKVGTYADPSSILGQTIKFEATTAGQTALTAEVKADTTALQNYTTFPIAYTYRNETGQLMIGINGTPGPKTAVEGMPVKVRVFRTDLGELPSVNGHLRANYTVTLDQDIAAVAGKKYQIFVSLPGGYNGPTTEVTP